MQIWRLDLPLKPDDTLEREALLWDLAGQEDYRLIHQLWLDETSVALVLIDPQHKDPFSEAGDWVKALHAAVGASSSAAAERRQHKASGASSRKGDQTNPESPGGATAINDSEGAVAPPGLDLESDAEIPGLRPGLDGESDADTPRLTPNGTCFR